MRSSSAGTGPGPPSPCPIRAGRGSRSHSGTAAACRCGYAVASSSGAWTTPWPPRPRCRSFPCSRARAARSSSRPRSSARDATWRWRCSTTAGLTSPAPRLPWRRPERGHAPWWRSGCRTRGAPGARARGGRSDHADAHPDAERLSRVANGRGLQRRCHRQSDGRPLHDHASGRSGQPHDRGVHPVRLGHAGRHQADRRPAVAPRRPRRLESDDDHGRAGGVAAGAQEHAERSVVESGVPQDPAQLGDRYAADVHGADRIHAHRDHAVRRSGLLLSAFSAAWAAAARAQTPSLATGVDTLRPGSVEPASAVRVAAEPRSFRIVGVPVPAAFPTAREVRFEIVSVGPAAILGTRSGALPPARGEVRVVVFTAGLPARARAGVTPIARVRLSVPGGATVDVPVELDVARVPGAGVRLTRVLVAVPRGPRFSLGYLRTNAGNAPASLDVGMPARSGWQVRGPAPHHTLEADGTAQGAITVTVPEGTAPGAARLRLVVRGSGGERTRADAVIEVVDPDAVGATYAPRLTGGIATVVGDTGPVRAAIGLSLDGQLSDRLRVSGRLVQELDSRHLDTRGLGRVGYFPGAPYVTLASDRWQATGGTTGVVFSDLTGVNLWGKGASFAGGFDRWRLTALAGQPVVGGSGNGGPPLGTPVGWRGGGGWVNAAATDLEDPQGGARRLQAIALGGRAPIRRGPAPGPGAGHAALAPGAGLGWLMELHREAESDHLLLRYVHAPGGSGAVARVRNEVSGFGTRALAGGVLLSGSYWRSDDENAAFSRLHSGGWAPSPHVP